MSQLHAPDILSPELNEIFVGKQPRQSKMVKGKLKDKPAQRKKPVQAVEQPFIRPLTKSMHRLLIEIADRESQNLDPLPVTNYMSAKGLLVRKLVILDSYELSGKKFECLFLTSLGTDYLSFIK